MNKTYFAVTGIITHKDKILILKKGSDDYNYPDYWSFCSGFVKEFEAAEDTVVREITEETGLKGKILKKGKLTVNSDNDLKKDWVIMTFLCSVERTEVKLDHENTDFRWVTKEELKNYKFVPGLMNNLKSVGIL